MAKGDITNRRKYMIPFCILLVNWYWGRWSDHGFKKRTNEKKKKKTNEHPAAGRQAEWGKNSQTD